LLTYLLDSRPQSAAKKWRAEKTAQAIEILSRDDAGS